VLLFFFQAEDGIRDDLVTGVQTCALPISCEAIDFPLPPAMNEEVEVIIATIEQAEGFLVYTHGDPCPGNDCCLADHLRLFDFERSEERRVGKGCRYGGVRAVLEDETV